MTNPPGRYVLFGTNDGHIRDGILPDQPDRSIYVAIWTEDGLYTVKRNNIMPI